MSPNTPRKRSNCEQGREREQQQQQQQQEQQRRQQGQESQREGFVLQLGSDGTLDPECLAQAGGSRVKQWLTGRLSGHDPIFPIDPRVDEDPEGLVVDVVRDAGHAHSASVLISKAVAALLERALKEAPKIPPFFRSALRLCQRIRLPQTNSWFIQEIKEMARAPAEHEKRWGGYDVAKEIAYGAIVQAAGLPTAASHKSWLRLLKKPKYATLALLGLGQSFAEQASHLGLWWQSCPPDERERELGQLVFTGLSTQDHGTIISILRSVGHSFPNDLQQAINEALRENKAAPAFPLPRGGAHSCASAIAGAGQRREFVLARAG